MIKYDCEGCGIKFESTRKLKLVFCQDCWKVPKSIKYWPDEEKVEQKTPEIFKRLDPSIESIYGKILSSSDELTKIPLKNYLIIELAKQIDTGFRDLFINNLFFFNPENKKKFFPNKKIKKSDLKKWKDEERENAISYTEEEKRMYIAKWGIKETDPKKLILPDKENKKELFTEKMIASTISFQNMKSVDEIFSTLMDLDFFNSLRTYAKVYSDDSYDEDFRNVTEEIMNVRHRKVHTNNEEEIPFSDLLRYIHFTDRLLILMTEMLYDFHNFMGLLGQEGYDDFSEKVKDFEAGCMSFDTAKNIFKL